MYKISIPLGKSLAAAAEMSDDINIIQGVFSAHVSKTHAFYWLHSLEEAVYAQLRYG